VGHTFLYSPAVRKIKEIVEWGDLGEIRYICARRLNLGFTRKTSTWLGTSPRTIFPSFYTSWRNCH